MIKLIDNCFLFPHLDYLSAANPESPETGTV